MGGRIASRKAAKEQVWANEIPDTTLGQATGYGFVGDIQAPGASSCRVSRTSSSAPCASRLPWLAWHQSSHPGTARHSPTSTKQIWVVRLCVHTWAGIISFHAPAGHRKPVQPSATGWPKEYRNGWLGYRMHCLVVDTDMTYGRIQGFPHRERL